MWRVSLPLPPSEGSSPWPHHLLDAVLRITRGNSDHTATQDLDHMAASGDRENTDLDSLPYRYLGSDEGSLTRCSPDLVGTCNRDGVLSDQSGSHRFWVLAMNGRTDPVALVNDRDRIWQAALLPYRASREPILSPASPTKIRPPESGLCT